MSIIAQIADIQAQITAKKSQIAVLQASERDWRSQSQVSCSGKIGNKKTECLNDKAWKASQADSCLTQIGLIVKEIDLLVIDKKTLTDKQTAENTATINLSTQGTSLEALQTQAEGIAQATVVKAQGEADASAKIGEATARTVEDTSKMRNTIIIVSVASLILVLIFVVVAKIKKNKTVKP